MGVDRGHADPSNEMATSYVILKSHLFDGECEEAVQARARAAAVIGKNAMTIKWTGRCRVHWSLHRPATSR